MYVCLCFGVCMCVSLCFGVVWCGVVCVGVCVCVCVCLFVTSNKGIFLAGDGDEEDVLLDLEGYDDCRAEHRCSGLNMVSSHKSVVTSQ